MQFRKLNTQDIQLDHSLDVVTSRGTAAASVNIPLSESRGGFNPALAMQYSSAGRNSIFGIGWSLVGLPFISLDTSKRLPRYDGTDGYAFNGADPLVPYLRDDGGGWKPRVDDGGQFWIYYYRSKLESMFTRFEKWVNKTDGAIHWRTRSRDGVVSVFGRDPSGAGRIFDPEDPARVFSWLLEAKFDSSGNGIVYDYIKEDGRGVDPLESFESGRLSRFATIGFAQRHPRRILYGNTKPMGPDDTVPAGNKWLFEVVFDYGDFPQQPFTVNQPQQDWLKRKDPFSIYNPGFEIRTYRLCRRVLMIHHFDELSTPNSLVGIFTCGYHEQETGTTLESVSYTGVRRDLQSGTYSQKTLPPLTFNYTEPEVGRTFEGIVKETGENLPQGFNNSATRFVDLLGDGMPGILGDSGSVWYYKPNLGDGQFGKQEIVVSKPSHRLGQFSLGDFDQNGNINLFSIQGRTAGFYEYDRHQERWSGFTPLANIPTDSVTQIIDIDADGRGDLMVQLEDRIVCYPFKGKEGFDKPYTFAKPQSNGVSYAPVIGHSPALNFFLADMTGDGLPDQVIIQNGRVEYWPNLGYGRFGAKVTMESPPMLEFDDKYDAGRVRLYDLDGSGCADIVYIGDGDIRFWYNASGNKFVAGGRIANLPYIDNASSAVIIDFLGTGAPCLVWSSSLNHLSYSSVQYLQLTGGVKPRLLSALSNSMGMEVNITYSTSGRHYLRDKQRGEPWLSKLPGHVTVVDKKEVVDHIGNTRFVSRFHYRDGHYNGRERTFVTFGRVDQYDAEENAQPACLRTWFHSGMFGGEGKIIEQFYRKDPAAPPLTYGSLDDDIPDSDEYADAWLSVAGQPIRQELYRVAEDGSLGDHPFQVTQTAFRVRRLQPRTGKSPAAFMAYRSQTLTHEYEERPDDPRISQHFTVEVGAYGDVTKELAVAYGRRSGVAGAEPDQKRDIVTASNHSFTHVDTRDRYDIGIGLEGKDYEISPVNRPGDRLLSMKEILGAYDNLVANGRLVAWSRRFFWNDSLDAVLPHGQLGKQLLPHHEEFAVLDNAMVTDAFGGRVTPAMLSDPNQGNYIAHDGFWWQKTAVNSFLGQDKFFSLAHVTDAGGNITVYTHDNYFLNMVETKDPLGNVNSGEIDYNVNEPFRLRDPNGAISEVLYDELGVAVATFSGGTVLDGNGVERPYGNGSAATYQTRADANLANILARPKDFLQQADSYLFYNLDNWQTGNLPLHTVNLVREDLVFDGAGTAAQDTGIQISVSYIGGFGRILQTKQKVGPGEAVKRGAGNTIELDGDGHPVLAFSNERWLVSGHVQFNQKQQPSKQYEPFFSPSAAFETDDVLQRYGVAAVSHYDAVGRQIRVDFPNGSFSETRLSPWEVRILDQNDTVDRSQYKESRKNLAPDHPQRVALERALAHKDTPDILKLDPLGREIVRVKTNNDGTERIVRTRLDINGHVSTIIDPRGLTAFVYKRDLLGRVLYRKSVDAGESWSFHNSMDQTIHLWDGRGIHQRTSYDGLGRVVAVHVDGALGLDHTTETFVYGEDNSLGNNKERNLRGRLVQHRDQAGVQTVEQYTPSGLPMASGRQLSDPFGGEPDWSQPATVTLGPEIFESRYSYDAIGRQREQRLPDGTTRSFAFHPSGGVRRIVVSTADGDLVNKTMMAETVYDAKNLRQRVLLGNDVEIRYHYDPETFRLHRLLSRQTAGPKVYQDIAYTYDPVGNLVRLADRAQPFAAIPAQSDYTYDALYQLKTAGGRVHQALLRHDYLRATGTRHITLNNGAAVERYTRDYTYDIAGNIETVKHIGASQQWTRSLWTSPTSNRSLPRDDPNGNPVANPEQRFDENGNCVFLPHLRSLEWNYRNMISKAVIIDRSAQGKADDAEFYVYGGDGLRVRKLTQRVVDVANNTIELTEKIYLDGCEIKRRTLGGQEVLKRFTSIIGDGKNTVALIHHWEKDSQARETGDTSVKKIHYQLPNHLGSAALELDDSGDIITYEEYFPYGGTSFMAGPNSRDIALKDYRYSGKERDDFSGLYYFGYRYYAHWIGGWLSPDPLGPEDSENLYLFIHNNPINLVDPNGLQTTVTQHKTPDLKTKKDAMNYWEGRIVTRDGVRVRVHVTSIKPGTGGAQWDVQADLTPVGPREERIQETRDMVKEMVGESIFDTEEMEEFMDFTLPEDVDEYGDPESFGDGTGDGTGDEEKKGREEAKPQKDDETGEDGDGKKKEKPKSKAGKTGKTGGTKKTGKKTGTGRKKVDSDAKTGNGEVGGSETGDVNGELGGTGESPEGSLEGKGLENGQGFGGQGIDGDGGPVPGNGGQAPQGGGPLGGTGEGNRSGGGGTNTEELSWWERGLLAIGGALFSVANIFIEAGKQLWDLGGMLVEIGSIASGWYNYEHDFVSGIGQAAVAGQGTVDIFKAMGRGIIETPDRWWDAAERGDWFAFGSESMNFYMLGRSAASTARGTGSFAFNRTVGGIGRMGEGLASRFASSTSRFGTAMNRLGQGASTFRTVVRQIQVNRLESLTRNHFGNRLPNNLIWRYGGDQGGRLGSFNYVTRTVSINEGVFTPKLQWRLPSLRASNPYFVFSRLGISRLLKGYGRRNTPYHEGWHSIQHAQHPAWYQSTFGRPYFLDPSEFTLGVQPMMGAHNYGFRFAPPSHSSQALGWGSFSFNTASDQ